MPPDPHRMPHLSTTRLHYVSITRERIHLKRKSVAAALGNSCNSDQRFVTRFIDQQLDEERALC